MAGAVGVTRATVVVVTGAVVDVDVVDVDEVDVLAVVTAVVRLRVGVPPEVELTSGAMMPTGTVVVAVVAVVAGATTNPSAVDVDVAVPAAFEAVTTMRT